MATRDAYLDATALAARISHDRHTYPQLLQRLGSYSTKMTSQYVLMEIRRGFVRYLVYLYHCTLDEDNLAAVHHRVERLLGTPQNHRPRTMLQNLRIFFEEIQNTRLRMAVVQDTNGTLGSYMLQAIRALLRMRIRNCWEDLHSFLDGVVNEMQCSQGLEGPTQTGDRFDATLPFCERLEAACRVAEFCRDHKAELERVLAALSNSRPDNETKLRIDALTSVLSDYSKARSHTTCWRLGDLLVCLESPSSADVVNNNARHMDAICGALGKASVHWL
jgi:hypothetical protein